MHVRTYAVLMNITLSAEDEVATRKLGVDKAVAKRKAELMAKLEVISIRPDVIFGAIDLQRQSDLSFWDALIIKAVVWPDAQHC